MKIAIFENEYDSVKGAFETANFMYFNNGLEIEIYPSSQKADFSKINQYSVIFIDIDLSSKSELDGFALIEKILEIDKKFGKKIIILTGNNKISDILKERHLDTNSIQIIIKPTNYDELTKHIYNVNPQVVN